MKLLKMSFLRSVLKNEQGQSLVFVALLGTAGLIGVAGISLDLVNAYVARQQLQASTNSAALSGAVYLSNSYLNTAAATQAAILYSSETGQNNTASGLTNVQLNPAPSFICSTTVTTSMGIPCLGTPPYNTMIVTQTADVNTWFARIFNIPVFHMSATAYATPGGAPAPLNLAIIVDTTGSMTDSDPNCPGFSSQLECAKNGVAVMMRSLPFPQDAPVALFTFPNIEASTVPNDLSSATTITQMAYTTPTLGASSYTGGTGSNATYEIVPFSTDYTQINEAVGTVDSSGNTLTTGHLKTPSNYNPTNYHTFLAGAIVAAQSALVAEQAVHPVALGQNVIVILTDGDSNASDQYKTLNADMNLMASSFSVTASSPSYIPTAPSDIPMTTAGTYVTYPSGVGGCGQAVQVAQAARASTLQTSIFVVAYGALMTGEWNPLGTALTSGNIDGIMGGTGASQSHCDSDQDAFFTAFKTTGKGTLPTTIHGVTYTNLSYKPNISPCTTAQEIASPNTSTIVYFYSDTMSGTSGTCPSTSTLTTLHQIFSAIVGELPHVPRIVPNNTN
jgi:hypothetical protein